MYQNTSGSFLPSSQVMSQAAGKPGLLEQLLGLGRAVLVALEVLVVAPQRRRLELRRGQAGAAVQRVDDRLPVDGVGEGLAHALVLELLHLVVEGDVAGGVGRAQQHLQVGVALHHRHVVGVEALHAVDLAGLERAQPLRVVLDVAHDHALDLGLHAPVVGVRLQHHFLVRLPLDELEGSGAHRVLAELRPPLLDGGRARDVEGEHGQVRQERRLRILEGDAHGVRARSPRPWSRSTCRRSRRTAPPSTRRSARP